MRSGTDMGQDEARAEGTAWQARTGAARRWSSYRLVIPLVLAAGWGALLSFSGMVLLDEGATDAALRPGRAAFAEEASLVDLPSVPIRSTAAVPPGTRWLEPGRPSDAAEGGRARRIDVTTALPMDVPVESPALETPALPEPALPEAEGPRTYVGTWGPTAAACGARSRRRGYLPANITLDSARAGRTFCRFRSGRREGSGWTLAADCSDRGRRWTSQVRLLVEGDRLTWSSGKGSSTYVRCARREG